MQLQGQGCYRRRQTCPGERGYAMAALLVGISIMAVVMTMAMPMWKTFTKREKEAELVWRASQYVRAIALFQRKYANAYPPNLDILLNERFLRKKYKDPFTKDGEFQLIYAGDQQQRPINPGGGPPGTVGTTTPPPQLDPTTRAPAGARGGIIGVVSKSTETGFRLFNGRTKYNEWTFTPQTVLGNRAPGAGGNQPGGVPGSNRPGGVGPGNVRPGGGGATRPGGVTPQGATPGQPRPFGLPPRPPQ
jgi:type II secretory pathway pseudopilin PulG